MDTKAAGLVEAERALARAHTWPEPQENVGAIPPLFDSRRSYMEQIGALPPAPGQRAGPDPEEGIPLQADVCDLRQAV